MFKILFAALMLFHSSAFAQTIILEAFGDSITAGLLSYTNATDNNDLKVVSKILSELVMFKLTKNRDYLINHEKHELAWPQLLANRLTKSDVNFEIRNYALSGARSDLLPEEVEHAKVVKEDETAIAFFFIGHNDLCHHKGTPEELASEYMLNFNKAVEAWDKKHKGAKAFFVSIAEIQRIYPLLDGQTWYESGRGRYRCNDSWEKLFPYCLSFYKKYQQGTLNDYLSPRVETINNSLDQMASEWKAKSSRNQYFHIGMDSKADFKNNFFAVDCYHLSTEGQKFISDQVFNTIGWQ